MAYDKNIPDVLQLLRLDLGNVDYTVPMDTTIARYTIDGDYFPRYCIADASVKPRENFKEWFFHTYFCIS